MATLNGTAAGETINGTEDSDTINGLGGNDTLNGNGGDDFLTGGEGDDTVNGGAGNDVAYYTFGTDGADVINLGSGFDAILVGATATTNVRLTFTSAEVGNGNGLDSNSMANQDGGLAVRMQGEVGGTPTGSISRIDDEGVTFVGLNGVTFDVRDLVAGTQRGELFNVVALGTSGAETLTAQQGASLDYYFNGGLGDDILQGADGVDVLVGGGGNDVLVGGAASDTLLGGGGNDTIDSLDRPSNIFAGSIAPVLDIVDAGDGDDTVTGGRLDQLNGGAGNDSLLLNFAFNGPVAGSAPAVNLTLDANGTGTASGGTLITGFESVNFNLTDLADTVNTGNVTASLAGNDGNDALTTGSGNDQLFGGGGNDVLSSGAGNDTLDGGQGNDTINGGEGDDQLSVNVTGDGRDTVNLGAGNDTVTVNRNDGGTGQVRVTFTSAEAGNGSANDAGTMTNQDGGLAVRFQTEDASGNLVGDVSRYDDEGITFVAGTQGTTFDVRDLVSGTARGDTFEGVVLGTSGADNLTFFPPFRSGQNFYYNAGQGNDTVIAGSGNDFLVGGAGDDVLNGGDGNNSFIGGAGNDTIIGGAGNDTVFYNAATDGVDTFDLGGGRNTIMQMTAAGAPAGGQIRLTFTSSEVGNGNNNDSNTMANQDGGLAVRYQAEDSAGNPTGGVTRFGDEGATFVAAAGQTFDVRDLVSGVSRGDFFEVVVLGTSAADTLTAVQADRPYYFNGGQGDDTITGGNARDFIVGGAGNDTLSGGAGNDQFLGGAGVDTINGGDGDDVISGGAGADVINGGAGIDYVAYDEATSTIFVNLTTGRGFGSDADGDTLTNIENVRGGSGNDTLQGNEVANILVGGGGNDTLIGGLGGDVLAGGEGIDTASYADNLGAIFVNLASGLGGGNAGSAGDVFSSIENVTGTAFADIIGGDNGANRLDGSSGNDVLVGRLGADVLVGGDGNDTASYVDNEGAVLVDLAAGRGYNNAAEGDTYQGIENAVGTSFNDVLIGDANNNILTGFAGSDRLTGGAGADQFVLDAPLDAGFDTITDFVSGTDKIVLEDSVFTGLSAGTVSSDAFVAGAAAADGNDRLVYNQSTGALFYDADGNGSGAAVQIAQLGANTALTAGDFMVM